MRMRAISIRQPLAELIMRKIKRIEYRSRPTHIRGRVYVYACLGGPKKPDAEVVKNCRKHYGVVFQAGRSGRSNYVDYESLPRGVLVGTVEIVDCQGGDGEYEWHLKSPRRARRLLKPKNLPQPVFFYPF